MYQASKIYSLFCLVNNINRYIGGTVLVCPGLTITYGKLGSYTEIHPQIQQLLPKEDLFLAVRSQITSFKMYVSRTVSCSKTNLQKHILAFAA